MHKPFLLTFSLLLLLVFTGVADAKVVFDADERGNPIYISVKAYDDVTRLLFVKTTKSGKQPEYLLQYRGVADKAANAPSTVSAWFSLRIDNAEKAEDLKIIKFITAPLNAKTSGLVITAAVSRELAEKIYKAKEVAYNLGSLAFDMPYTPPNGADTIKDEELGEWKRIINME